MAAKLEFVYEVKDNASAHMGKIRRETAQMGDAVANTNRKMRESVPINKQVADSFNFSSNKLKEFTGRLIGLGAGIQVVFKTIGAMKQQIVDSVKAYEDFGRAIGDERVKKLDETREAIERIRIELGGNLYGAQQTINDLTRYWLIGVNDVAAAMRKVFAPNETEKIEKQLKYLQGLLDSNVGGNKAKSGILAEMDALWKRKESISTDKPEIKTAKERAAEEKAAQEAERIRQENLRKASDERKRLEDVALSNAQFDQEQKDKAAKREYDAAQKLLEQQRQNALDINEVQIAITEIELSQSQKRIEQIKKEMKEKQDAHNQDKENLWRANSYAVSSTLTTAEAILSISKTSAEKRRNILYAIAVAEGAAMIVTAAKSGYDEGSKISVYYGAFLAAAAAIEAAALTATEIAAIKSQSFASGGVMYNQGPANLHPNEVILNPRQQAEVLFKIANSSNGTTTNNNGSTNIYVNDNMTGQSLIKMLRSGDGRDAISELTKYQRSMGLV
jgi:hypothetical protein